MSQDFERFIRMAFGESVSAVAMSVTNGVVGCGCPSSCNATRIGRIFCPLENNPPVSASVAELTTWRSALHSTKIGPFRDGDGIVGDGGGMLLRKYNLQCGFVHLEEPNKLRLS